MEPGMYLTLKIYSNCSAEAGKEIKQTWFDSFKTRQSEPGIFLIKKRISGRVQSPPEAAKFFLLNFLEENLFEECFSKFAILKLNCSLILYRQK